MLILTFYLIHHQTQLAHCWPMVLSLLSKEIIVIKIIQLQYQRKLWSHTIIISVAIINLNILGIYRDLLNENIIMPKVTIWTNMKYRYNCVLSKVFSLLSTHSVGSNWCYKIVFISWEEVFSEFDDDFYAWIELLQDDLMKVQKLLQNCQGC